MFDPWKFEADAFTPDDDYEQYIIMNERIKKYLDVAKNEKDTNFFLIAPKGLGKTLLLKTKAHLYKKLFKTDIKFAKTDQLTDNLSIKYSTFSREELIKFSDLALWTNIWTFTLILVILDTMDIDFNTQLKKRFKYISISSIIMELINDRGKVNKFIHEHLSALTYQAQIEVKSAIALFIDNVDQQFLNILNNTEYNNIYENDKKVSVDVWTNAQIGLVAAIHDINKLNNHIRLFTTIRSEAFQCIGQLKSIYLSQSCELAYTKDEIRKIFENRIAYSKDKLINAAAKTEIEQFFDFTMMPHQYAKDAQGKKREEDTFDFLHRHSYGRPREIIRFGKNLIEKITYSENSAYTKIPKEEKIEKVRELVNDLSNELFNEYKTEIIPLFDNDQFDQLANSISSNVLTAKQMKRLQPQTTKWLYNLGLLGYAQRVQNNNFTQKFKTVARYNYTMMEDIPISEYYFFHPSLDKTFDNFINGNIYNDYNIIGDGYPFHEPKITMNVHELVYYFPLVGGDNRWKNASKYNKHINPLKECYKIYFSNDEVKLKTSAIEKNIDILTVLGKIKVYNILSTNSKKIYIDEIKNLEKTLRQYHPKKEYQSMLNIADSAFYDKFTDRLFGRIITIGAFSYLQESCLRLHDLFTRSTYSLDENHVFATNSDTAVRYLFKAFFIKGLINDSSATTANISRARKEVVKNASEYEQYLLDEWYRDFIDVLKDDLNKEELILLQKEGIIGVSK